MIAIFSERFYLLFNQITFVSYNFICCKFTKKYSKQLRILVITLFNWFHCLKFLFHYLNSAVQHSEMNRNLSCNFFPLVTGVAMIKISQPKGQILQKVIVNRPYLQHTLKYKIKFGEYQKKLLLWSKSINLCTLKTDSNKMYKSFDF